MHSFFVQIVRAMFAAFVVVQVGNGARTLFWDDKWLAGADIASMAPEVVAAVPNRIRKTALSVTRSAARAGSEIFPLTNHYPIS
jgi:hypothetical protein